MSASQSRYYVPAQSHWPIVAATGLFLTAMGAANLISASSKGDGSALGGIMLAAGALVIVVMFFGWFGNVIREGFQGLYSDQMDASYRWGMGWFIFSEVMFFLAFFGALFYARVFALPWLGGEGDKGVSNMLWPDFVSSWPLFVTPDMDQFPGPKEIISPWQIPLLNTVLLVASSITLTIAHKALYVGNRAKVKKWLAATIGLGAIFLFFQAYEYYEAYVHLGLTLSSGIYGSTFFLLTGFHGAHVTIGAIMLTVILVRVIRGHFSAEDNFGFEAVSWYWHFVDVVWICLFIFVYVL